MQCDRRSDHLGQITGRDCKFGDDPERERHPFRVGVAAGLGQIAPRHDAQLGRQSLEQDRHQVAQQDDVEQRVTKLGAAGEVGGPVARVHISDGDEVSRTAKGEELPEPVSAADRNRPVRFGKGGRLAGASPAGDRAGSRYSGALRRRRDRRFGRRTVREGHGWPKK